MVSRISEEVTSARDFSRSGLYHHLMEMLGANVVLREKRLTPTVSEPSAPAGTAWLLIAR